LSARPTLFPWSLAQRPHERDDARVVLAAIQVSPSAALSVCSERLRRHRGLVLCAVRREPWALLVVVDLWRDDPHVARAAVARGGAEFLQFFSPRVRDDEAVVRAALRGAQAHALRHASDRLRADARFVLELLREDYQFLVWACPTLRSDSAFFARAVRVDNRCFEFANHELRNDVRVAAAAVEGAPARTTLEHAAEAPRDDAALVERAVRRWGGGQLRLASPRLREDVAFIRPLVDIDPSAFFWAGETPRGDRALLVHALRHPRSGECDALLARASLPLRDDPDVVRTALRHSGGGAIYGASPRLRADRGLLAEAVASAESAILHAHGVEDGADPEDWRALVQLALGTADAAHRRGGVGFLPDQMRRLYTRAFWRFRRLPALRGAVLVRLRRAEVADTEWMESDFVQSVRAHIADAHGDDDRLDALAEVCGAVAAQAPSEHTQPLEALLEELDAPEGALARRRARGLREIYFDAGEALAGEPVAASSSPSASL